MLTAMFPTSSPDVKPDLVGVQEDKSTLTFVVQ